MNNLQISRFLTNLPEIQHVNTPYNPCACITSDRQGSLMITLKIRCQRSAPRISLVFLKNNILENDEYIHRACRCGAGAGYNLVDYL